MVCIWTQRIPKENKRLKVLHFKIYMYTGEIKHIFEGISVLNQFNETSVMLYVEGDDDIPFWKHLFKKYAPKNFCEIEQTHGKEGLELYKKEEIKNGTLHNVMVACDSDYSCISNY